MDDLTSLKGIGAATASKLVAAGIDDFAKLAAATSDVLAKIDGLPGTPAAWASWIEAATEKMARPMTAAELSALVKAWDDARAELKAAGDAVAALDANAAAEDVEAAKARVSAAEKTIADLTPLPEGVVLPAAKAKPVHSNTPQSNGDKSGGGNAAAPAGDLTKAVAICSVLWMGRTFAPNEPLEPDLPQAIFEDLERFGAVRAAD